MTVDSQSWHFRLRLLPLLCFDKEEKKPPMPQRMPDDYISCAPPSLV